MSSFRPTPGTRSGSSTAGWPLGDPVVFAGNELAVIVPAGNPGGLASPADLARTGVKVIAAGDEVPITKYATQLVANLAEVPGYPPGFEEAYVANVVSQRGQREGRGRQGRAGRGGRRHRRTSPTPRRRARSTRSRCPSGANVQATYAGVVVEASDHPDAAAAFLDWFAGPGGGRSSRASGSCRRHDGDTRSRRAPARRGFGRPLPWWRSPPCSPCSWACRCWRSSSGPHRRAAARRRRLRRRCLTALALSLATTAISLVITVCSGLPLAVRPGPPAVPRQVAGGDGRRPADRAAAVRGRPRAAAGVRAARAARRAADAVGARHRVHDARGGARPGVRLGAVLRPLGAGRDRGRGPRPRGRRARGRRVGAAAVPAGHRAAGGRRRSRPGW